MTREGDRVPAERRWTGAALRTAVLGGALTVAVGAGAQAAGGTVRRHSETVELYDARTITVNVPYPAALEFAGATYSGAVRIIGAPAAVGGRRPRAALVRVLSDGSAEGGSVFRVRIRNSNPTGTLADRAVITAITVIPAGS